MSGSGGYPKFRCKYFQTHGCERWVMCKGTPCPWCVAEGRDAVDIPEQPLNYPREVCVPIVHQGTITYIIMDLVQTGQTGSYWTLRRKTTQQPLMPAITTSDTPGVVLPTTGMGTHLGH